MATERAHPNRYPGRCIVCKAEVPVSHGFIRKNESNRWQIFCRSTECLRKAGFDVEAMKNSLMEQNVRKFHADGSIEMPYDAEALPVLRAMPKAVFKKDTKRWHVSLLAEHRLRVLELADRIGLEVDPGLRAYSQSSLAREAVDRAKAWVDADGRVARDYQLLGVQVLADHRRWLLGDDMGLGKTAQVLWAADPGYGLLVICPASVKHTWFKETQKFRPDLTPRIIGKDNFRWPEPGEVLIINYERIPEEPANVVGQAGDHVQIVLDEAHRCKNYKTKRTQKIRALADCVLGVWLLTGTPLTDRPFDLWGVLNIARLNDIVFGGWMGFLRSFGGRKGRFGGYVFSGPDRSVPERLRNAMLRRLKSEVLKELPPKTYETLWLSRDILGASLLTAMDQADGEWVGQGLPPLESLSAIREQLAQARIPSMLDFVRDCEEQDEKLIVFSAHRAPILALQEHGWKIITGTTPIEERNAIVDAFQRGELPGIGCTITAGGVGLTLTQAATVLFVDLDWTPANNAQAEDRVHRLGQAAEVVRIVTMLVDHPLEARVHEILSAKKKLIHNSIDNLAKYRIEEIPSASDLALIDEDEDAWVARYASQNPDERDKAVYWACGKIGAKLGALHDRGINLPTSFSDEQSEYLRKAVRFLAARCDGAVERDRVGFNKTDTAVGHWLAIAGMDLVESLQVAWVITRKYARQLQEMENDE